MIDYSPFTSLADNGQGKFVFQLCDPAGKFFRLQDPPATFLVYHIKQVGLHGRIHNSDEIFLLMWAVLRAEIKFQNAFITDRDLFDECIHSCQGSAGIWDPKNNKAAPGLLNNPGAPDK